MNKIIVSIIIIIVVITSAFAGCVGKEPEPSTETPSPTSTPKQVTETTAVIPTSTSTPTVIPTQKKTINLTLKSGYNWHQDNEFNYKIGYPENWQIYNQSKSKIVVNNISGWVSTEVFDSPTLKSNGLSEASIWVSIYPNETLAKWWMQDYNNLEKLKEIGAVIKYGNITINSREGYEVIYDPFMTSFGRKTHLTTIRMVVFDDAPNNLYYSIMVFASSISESGQVTDLYPKYNNTFNNVINSFVIEN